MQNGCFLSKSALLLKKVCYKVSLCENHQQQSSKAFIGLSIRVKMIGGGRPLLCENRHKLTHPFKNANFKSVFARSASSVTPSEKSFKSSINANRKSTVSLPMSLR